MMHLVGPLWIAVQVLGAIAIAFGGRRALGAVAAADVRAVGHENAETYRKGLIDFYRISGALVAFVGLVLVLIPIFAR